MYFAVIVPYDGGFCVHADIALRRQLGRTLPDPDGEPIGWYNVSAKLSEIDMKFQKMKGPGHNMKNIFTAESARS